MSTTGVWLVPVAPSPGMLEATGQALAHLDVPHRLVGPDELRVGLRGKAPAAAILQASRLRLTLLEAQRRLTEHRVPTLVLLEVLDDQREALLLGRGAQDVVLVPTSPTRLRARVLALHRSRRPAAGTEQPFPTETQLSVPPDLTVYPERRVATVGERHVNLTRSEFDLLVVLAETPTDVVPRQRLAIVLGHDDPSPRALESHLSRLRLKLRAAGAPRLVNAVRGAGYRLLALQDSRGLL